MCRRALPDAEIYIRTFEFPLIDLATLAVDWLEEHEIGMPIKDLSN